MDIVFMETVARGTLHFIFFIKCPRLLLLTKLLPTKQQALLRPLKTSVKVISLRLFLPLNLLSKPWIL